MGVFGSRPVALLTVVSSDNDVAVDPIYIGSMFNLTPAEARLATALLKGGTLKSISSVNRVSLETVRAQLHAVFHKTNTHRQAELVSLLHEVSEN